MCQKKNYLLFMNHILKALEVAVRTIIEKNNNRENEKHIYASDWKQMLTTLLSAGFHA